MEPNVLIEAERAALLAEIATLEQQIAALTGPESDKQPRAPQRQRPRQAENERLEHDIEQTIRDLLAANDSALLAAHPPKPKDYEATEQDSVALERAYELLQHNAAFTGIELAEADSRLINVGQTHQHRQHTMIGTLPSPSVPLGFRVRLTVREPVLVGETDPSAADPGSEYEVESLEAEVWGGGTELQQAIDALRLSTRPNPPALFSRLREYSLLASQRHELFAALRESMPRVVDRMREGEEGRRDSLSFSSGSLSLMLSHTIQPSAQTGSLEPTLSLDAVLGAELDRLPTQSIDLLQNISLQFCRMLAEGFDPQKATELLVKTTFGLH